MKMHRYLLTLAAWLLLVSPAWAQITVQPGPNVIALLDGSAVSPSKSYVNSPGLGSYRIGADNEGFAAAGVLKLDYNTARLSLNSINLLCAVDGGCNIGAAGANRPDSGYFKTSIVTPVLDRGADLSLAIQVNSGTRWSIDNSAGGVSGTAYALSPVDNTGAIGTTTRRVANANIGSYVAIGTNPATVGAVRFANNTYAVWRDGANTANLAGIGVDASNNFFVGVDFTSVQLGGASPLIKIGGLTSAFPALKRNGTNLDVRLADDSAYATLHAGTVYAEANIFMGVGQLAGIQSPGAGVLTLLNNAGTDFDRLQFGGTSSSFPSLKRSGTRIDARKADDSADADFGAGTLYAGGTLYYLDSTGALQARVLSIGTSPASAGEVRLPNNGGGIQFRNAANAADFLFAKLDNTNQLIIGNTGLSDIRFIAQGSTGFRFSYNNDSSKELHFDGSNFTNGGDNTIGIGTAGLRFVSAFLSTSVSIGTNPATAGAVRLANGLTIQARNSGNSGNLQILALNSSNQVVLAESGADIKWAQPNVALGGGAAPTLGTIGGSGPASAAQNAWMRVIDSTGAAFWVPTWK